MAQTGYTPIQLYHSTTASNTPSAGNLLPGELAINTADGKLFYEDSLGAVQVIATTAGASGDVVGPASATDGNLAAFDGVTGKLIKQAATVTVAQGGTGISSGTSGGVPYFSGSTTIASSAALTANALVIGGGAGSAPATTATGTGVLTALGNNINAAGGFTTIDGTATLTNKTLTNPTVTNYTETNFTATVTGNAITLALTNGTFQTITTMVGVNAFTLPTVSGNAGKSLTVQIFYASTPTSVTWAAATGTLKWPGGVTPTATLTNGKYDFYAFMCDGTNWYGVQSGANF